MSLDKQQLTRTRLHRKQTWIVGKRNPNVPSGISTIAVEVAVTIEGTEVTRNGRLRMDFETRSYGEGELRWRGCILYFRLASDRR